MNEFDFDISDYAILDQNLSQDFSASLFDNPNIVDTYGFSDTVIDPSAPNVFDIEDAEAGQAMTAAQNVLPSSFLNQAGGFFSKLLASNPLPSSARKSSYQLPYPMGSAPMNPLSNNGMISTSRYAATSGNASAYNNMMGDWQRWIIFGAVAAAVVFVFKLLLSK